MLLSDPDGYREIGHSDDPRRLRASAAALVGVGCVLGVVGTVVTILSI